MWIGVTLEVFHRDGTVPEEKEELKMHASLLLRGNEQVLSNTADISSGPDEVLLFME